MKKKTKKREPDYLQIKNEIGELLKKHPEATILFFKFLSLRERTSTESDVSQLISYMRHDAAFKIDRATVMDILTTLAQCGIGTLSGDDTGRTKFEWHYWLFPLFGMADKKQFLGLEIKDIEVFKDRNNFKATRLQAERYALNLSSSTPDPGLIPDVVFERNESSPTKSLESASLDDLTKEIERRGWYVSLTKIPTPQPS